MDASDGLKRNGTKSNNGLSKKIMEKGLGEKEGKELVSSLLQAAKHCKASPHQIGKGSFAQRKIPSQKSSNKKKQRTVTDFNLKKNGLPLCSEVEDLFVIFFPPLMLGNNYLSSAISLSLSCRRRNPDRLFCSGSYHPISAVQKFFPDALLCPERGKISVPFSTPAVD